MSNRDPYSDYGDLRPRVLPVPADGDAVLLYRGVRMDHAGRLWPSGAAASIGAFYRDVIATGCGDS
jgi:hypothetical protein